VFSLVHWKKVAEALFSDSSFVAAGKKRGFCRLAHRDAQAPDRLIMR
jgi:hypothetical protein